MSKISMLIQISKFESIVQIKKVNSNNEFLGVSIPSEYATNNNFNIQIRILFKSTIYEFEYYLDLKISYDICKYLKQQFKLISLKISVGQNSQVLNDKRVW